MIRAVAVAAAVAVVAVVAVVVVVALGACAAVPAPGGGDGAAPARTRLVFRYQPLGGDPAPFRALLAEFERMNPDVALVVETMPNGSDLAHQLLLTALESGAADFDVFVADVIWVPEFARAGWIADLSAEFPPDRLRAAFLPGPVEATVLDGRTWAVPWFVDVGLLYYRKDLVPRAPATYAELAAFAREAMARDPALHGFVWQGRQYEGLTCNAYEALWGHGGSALRDGRVVVDTPEARAALAWMRGLVASGVTPGWVTTADEEEARRVFHEGRAVFMRNWPYAWAEGERAGSPIRGKVATAPLPTVDGTPGSGALGGWQLAVNAGAPAARRAAAARLVAHLTSPEAGLLLALRYGRNPARRDLYRDARLVAGAPFIAGLLPAVERARPRPVTPYYNLLADVLQAEFSAVVAGLRTPEDALARAQIQIDRLTAATAAATAAGPAAPAGRGL